MKCCLLRSLVMDFLTGQLIDVAQRIGRSRHSQSKTPDRSLFSKTLVLAPLPERATLLPFLQLSKSIIIHKPSYYYLVVLLLYKKFSEKSTKSGTSVRIIQFHRTTAIHLILHSL